MFPKKIKFKPTDFYHHRSGWQPVSSALHNYLHNDNGIIFYDWADRVFKDMVVVEKDWVGILHNVIRYPVEDYKNKYSNRIHSLANLVQQPHFLKSIKFCKGIFTLSDHTATFLKKYLKCEITSLTHPVLTVNEKFNLNNYKNQVVTIGQWLRRYHSIADLQINFEKILIKTSGFNQDYIEMRQYSKFNNVKILEYLNNNQYDELLASAVVFLDLYDAAACNVVLECIIRNTPILINKLPAVVEYLGPTYPLFYSDLNEASNKLNIKNIEAAHLYLKNMNKDKFSIDKFLNKFVNSKIYQEIKC